MRVLTLNVGSSSIKTSLFDGETLLDEFDRPATAAELPARVAEALDRGPRPDAVGHRVVHGGPHLTAPARIDEGVRAALDAAVHFAPLHLPSELLAIDAVAARWPDLPQVACFDTAFHARMPEVARRLALPRELFDRGVRRYGFHGLSYEWIVESIGARALGRAVIAHLGNGASMAAVENGQPVDTTMGLTPAGGLVMGTRPGDLDPGVLVHLLENGVAKDARELDRLINRASGLLGISGTTSDMRTLLSARATDPRAAMAVAMFVHSARKHVGALAAALGGLDTLVFTGGIGEHAREVREEICAGVAHLGARVMVVPTDEERMIARHVARLLSARGDGGAAADASGAEAEGAGGG